MMNDKEIKMLKKELEIDAEKVATRIESFISASMENLEREGESLKASFEREIEKFSEGLKRKKKEILRSFRSEATDIVREIAKKAIT